LKALPGGSAFDFTEVDIGVRALRLFESSSENSFGPRLISKRCLVTFLARIGEFLHNLGRKSNFGKAGYAFFLWMGQK
jgi:hypothetical protein